MRHVNEGDADVVLEALDEELHLLTQLQVEGSERLVEQEDSRTVDERACERDPLLLTSRELTRLALSVPAQLDEVEHFLDLAFEDSSPRALSPQAEGDVLEDREVREEGVALEDRVDVPLVRRRPADRALAEVDRTRCRLLETADHPQRRRLAATRRTEQGKEAAARDLEREVVDRDDVVELLRDSIKPDIGGAGWLGSTLERLLNALFDGHQPTFSSTAPALPTGAPQS